MAGSSIPLTFETDFDPRTGEPVTVEQGIVRVTAPNASPYTFTGTNSFLIGEERLLLVDPGPEDGRHEAALLNAIHGRMVEAVLLTHTHRDHSALAKTMSRMLGAPLWFNGSHRLSRMAKKGERNVLAKSSDWGLEPDKVLTDGTRLAIEAMEIEVIATPGHCANHIALGIVGTETLLTGDHIMGWSSTLVSAPDGSMADYLASLDKVLATPYRRYLPAHGGPIEDGPAYARALKAHRLARNEQIVAAVRAGARSVGAITRAVYPGLAIKLLPAARMTVAAHVDYLEELGMLASHRGAFGRRLITPVQAGSGV